MSRPGPSPVPEPELDPRAELLRRCEEDREHWDDQAEDFDLVEEWA